MANDAAPKSNDKVTEKDQATEKSTPLQNNVIELRKDSTQDLSSMQRPNTADKVLPTIQLNNSEKPGTDRPETDPAKAAPVKKDWTIAIDLGATLPGTELNPKGFGADNKLDYLKQLAKETEGKSVNFLVHADRTVGRDGNLCHDPNKPLSNEKADACDRTATEKNRAKSENYFIHDGKIEKLPDSKSKSPADDLKNLLKEAKDLAPSEKIGLIIQSHGGGAQGIQTNRGELSLANTAKSIEAGLKGSGHEKLDFLDFDACNMSTTPVLDKLAKVANNVVASAASEAAGQPTEKGDGQNLKVALQGLLNNPKQSGLDLAKSFVDHAKNGENGEGKTNNTITLASFDMSKYNDFKQGLDKFGQELSKVTGKDNINAIHEAINGTVRPQTEAEEFHSHERDLKQFAENTLKAIESGKLKTANDDLKNSAEDFLKSLNTLASNTFGEKAKGYENLGGLTARIPGSEILDKNELGRLLSPVHDSYSNISKMAAEELKFSDKKEIQKSLESMKELYQVLDGAPGNPLKHLKEARKEIDASKNKEELQHSLKKMASVLHDIENSPVGKELAKDSRRDASYIQAQFKREKKPTITPGWDAFIKKLESNTK